MSDPKLNTDDSTPDLEDMKAQGTGYDSAAGAEEAAGNLDLGFWKDHPLGRTLSLRNRTGKAIAAGVLGTSSNLLPEPIGGWVGKVSNSILTIQTGISMDLMNLDLLQIIIVAAGTLLVCGISLLFPSIRKKAIWKAVEPRIEILSQRLSEAVDKSSDGGKKITRSEIKDIIKDVIKG